jgi:hypothetical protein
MEHLYLLDLDRTLFNTELFLRDMMALLARHRGIDPAVFRAAIPRYRQDEFYDFYGQIAAMTGLSQADFDRLVGEYLGAEAYLYPDVAPWLRARPAGQTAAVITVGQEPFQQLKLRHARGLAGLSRTIIPTNKGAFIGRHLRSIGDGRYRLDFLPGEYTALSLVDDNPASFLRLGQPTPITTYHMARAGETYTGQPTPPGTTRITSLTNLL